MSTSSDEQVINMRVRNNQFQVQTADSMVHKINIDTSIKEPWESSSADTIKPEPPDSSGGEQGSNQGSNKP